MKFGGGARDVEVRVIDSMVGPMVIVHLLVDTLDAMGANAVNTMAEAVAPYLEEITGGTAELRILSNLADHRLVTARAVFKKEAIGGEEVVDKMLNAYAFAAADPYRAATHNKGIMNGIIRLFWQQEMIPVPSSQAHILMQAEMADTLPDNLGERCKW